MKRRVFRNVRGRLLASAAFLLASADLPAHAGEASGEIVPFAGGLYAGGFDDNDTAPT